ncbi:phosphopantothenoylcysteine decarboxylase-like, partial [Prunus avium]|uniref:Phosphopantothenoylcysteine decarboxylase-like n=1 Tax=Prunus avium TaxID=42229 RepID=A0A6P5T7P2_PRUAV
FNSMFVEITIGREAQDYTQISPMRELVSVSDRRQHLFLSYQLKIAGRLCDNLLTCVVRAWDYYNKPFFVAPAMNTLMWKNCFTERHIMSTGELGVSLIPPVPRRLGCGDYGNRAMVEPSLIYYTVRLFFVSQVQHSGSIVYEPVYLKPWQNAFDDKHVSLKATAPFRCEPH